MIDIKRQVLGKDPFIERIRAYAQIESGDVDYQFLVNFNDVQVKAFKNKDDRLEPSELGVLIYGRNLAAEDGSMHPLVKEALKSARSHLTEKKQVRTRDSITDDEIA